MSNYLQIYDNEHAMDVTAWKLYLAEQASAGQPVSFLADCDLTMQLTPEQIELLTGQNYIRSDAGDITVEYGRTPDILYNPTLFESGPMLEIEGYGTIGFNGYEIELSPGYIGQQYAVDMNGQPIRNYNVSGEFYASFDSLVFNEGDTITASSFSSRIAETFYPTGDVSNLSVVASDGATASGRAYKSGNAWIIEVNATFPQTEIQAVEGMTSARMGSVIVSYDITSHYSYQVAPTLYYHSYNPPLFGDDSKFMHIDFNNAFSSSSSGVNISVYSTVSMLGRPTYVDCEYGEAYLIDEGAVASLNKYIDLGSDLPKLAKGKNEIAFDDTVAELVIIPRWWKV